MHIRTVAAVLGIISLIGIAGCSGSQPVASGSAQSADQAIASEPAITSDQAAAPEPEVTFMDDLVASCRAFDLSALLPAHTPVTDVDYSLASEDYSGEEVSATEFGSCSVKLDTNLDGVLDLHDESGDRFSLQGGLLETIEGGLLEGTEVTSGALEDDSPVRDFVESWSVSFCTSGELAAFEAEGWNAASSCVEEGSLVALSYYLNGETEDGTNASMACGVAAYGQSLDGREVDIETTCRNAIDWFLV